MSDSDLALVRARRAAIAREREKLDAEDADLDVTERTLTRLAAAKRAEAGAPPKTISARNGDGTPSQKDMIIGVLRSEPTPWIESASRLQKRVKTIHGVEIPKTSLYPYLSGMKADGTIVRGSGGEIALAERLSRQKETAE